MGLPVLTTAVILLTGVLAATQRGSWLDAGSMLFALVGVALIVWALPRLARRCGVASVSALWLGAAPALAQVTATDTVVEGRRQLALENARARVVVLPRFHPVTVLALLATLVLIFAFLILLASFRSLVVALNAQLLRRVDLRPPPVAGSPPDPSERTGPARPCAYPAPARRSDSWSG